MRLLTTICLLAVSSVGCSKPQVVSVVHPSAHWRVYRTIGYGGTQPPPEGFTPGTVPPEIEAVLREAIGETLLDDLGFESASAEEADLVLYAAAGSRAVVNQQYVSYDNTDDGSGIADLQVDYAREIRDGALIFDLFERVSGMHVWHGHLSETTEVGAPVDLDSLRAAVRRIFATVPRAPRRSVAR